jgi:hypothetical membrane protein
MRSDQRVGAWCWLLTVEFFLAQFVAQAAWSGYSLSEQDISLLGASICGEHEGAAPCSPLAWVFNGGIILDGVLILSGLWLTRRLWPQNGWSKSALAFLSAGGVGCLLVGFFPVDQNLPAHMLGAFLALCIACFGFLALGIALWRHKPAFAIYSIATGIITLAGCVLYATGTHLGLGGGTMERVAAWPQTLWYMVTGVLLLTGRLRPSAA